MKRFIPILALVVAGCHQYILINHHFRPNGYLVVGMYGRWTWNEDCKTTTLVAGEGFEQRIYVDLNGDGAVDTVDYQYERIKRGADGSEELFIRADTDLAFARIEYSIDDVDKKWREMSPDDRVRFEDYFK